jgi:hypothetical protein
MVKSVEWALMFCQRKTCGASIALRAKIASFNDVEFYP